jgi:hypothetical protein
MKSSIRRVAISVLLALAACGPTTSVRNDTNLTVYVDLIKTGTPRPPSPQKLVSGQILTAPWRPAEAQSVYLGRDAANLKRYPVVELCNLTMQNCNIDVSQLPAFISSRH